MTTETQNPSSKQLADLQEYADFEGSGWKRKLQHDWYTPKVTRELQDLGKTHGPKWLATFKL